MSTLQSTIDFLVDQLQSLGSVTSKKMFGEYALYCEGRVVALVCDDQLFVKPTKAGREFAEGVVERQPYPGAKPYFWISGELWDDSEWLCELFQRTVKEVPIPKKRKVE